MSKSKTSVHTHKSSLYKASPYKTLKGTIYLTEHHNPKLDMRVYIFGEGHKTRMRCPDYPTPAITTDNFILGAIKKSKNVPIDLYLEIPYLTKGAKIIPAKKYPSDISYMLKLNNKLGGCLDRKKKCPLPNLRAHYVDMRKTPECFQVIKSILSPTYTIPHRLKILKGYYERLKSSPKANVFDFLQKECDIASKINKQKRFIDSEVLKIINEAHYSLLKGKNRDFSLYPTKAQYLKSLNAIITYLEECQKKRIKRLEYLPELVNKYFGVLVSYYTKVMDYYALLRMFRSYTPVKGKYSGRAKNLIVFVGDAHAIWYRSVLDQLGFTKKTSIGSDREVDEEKYWKNVDSGRYCLDISKLRYPLF